MKKFLLAAALAAITFSNAYAQVRPETLAFQKKIMADLAQAVRTWHEAYFERRQKGPDTQAEGYALAGMASLHAKTGDANYLAWAKEDMLSMASRKPLIHPFHIGAFVEAYKYLKDQRQLSAPEDQQVRNLIRNTLRAQYEYPDWGAHNRSVVAAAAYYRAAEAIPDDPETPKWRRFGDALVSESWSRWSIEDASLYNPFWFFHVLSSSQATKRVDEVMSFLTTKYYFDYYSRLMMPNDMLPDWGDGEWTSFWEWYVADMVWGGTYFRNGKYLAFAQRLYNYYAQKPLSGYAVYCAATALNLLDTSVPITPYEITRSEEALEDLVSKKIIFRNRNGRKSSYLMLNYRDQGPYGRYSRDYLNQVLAAYEEKPHHGHADENSITMLMEDQTVLLADGGYRPGMDFFAGWRADVFHNRVVARAGWPMSGDVLDYIAQNKLYSPVETEKVHFTAFGPIDYSRTRLKDQALGYTSDRIILFLPDSGAYIVVDHIRVDRAGHRVFANLWHPDNVLKQGEDYVVSWPPKIHMNKEVTWSNQRNRDLLIQFLPNRDAIRAVKSIPRRYHDSAVFYEYVTNHFFEGQRLTFVTLLRPHAPGSFREEMLKGVWVIPGSNEGNRSLGLEFDLNGHRAIAGLKLDQTIGLNNLRGRPMFDYDTGALSYGALKTDADFSFVIDKGAEYEFGAMYASKLEFAGKILFEMPVTKVIYQGPGEFMVPNARGKLPVYHETVAK